MTTLRLVLDHDVAYAVLDGSSVFCFKDLDEPMLFYLGHNFVARF